MVEDPRSTRQSALRPTRGRVVSLYQVKGPSAPDQGKQERASKETGAGCRGCQQREQKSFMVLAAPTATEENRCGAVQAKAAGTAPKRHKTMSKKKRQVPKHGFRPRVTAINPRGLLRALADEQKEKVEEQQRLVEELREAGVTWKEIADLTDMNSAQAARYRFTPKDPPPAGHSTQS